jgi:hypothetical protein
MPSPEPIIVPTHTKLYTQLVEKFASFSWSLTLRYAIYAVGTLLILWLVSKILQKVLRHLHQIKGEYICLEVTPPQITEDSSKSITGLFTQIAGLLQGRSFTDRIKLFQPSVTCEIISQKEKGIVFMIRVPKSLATTFEKTMRAYLPGLQVKETEDYLPIPSDTSLRTKILDFRFSKHFGLPLKEPDIADHDPLAYLTGNMTQLEDGEIMALQLVLRPINGFYQSGLIREISHLRFVASKDPQNLEVDSAGILRFVLFLCGLLESLVRIVVLPLQLLAEMITSQSADLPSRSKTVHTVTEREKETASVVSNKLESPLFEGTIRALIVVQPKNLQTREKGLKASFLSFNHNLGQTLSTRATIPLKVLKKFSMRKYERRLSGIPLVLSASEAGSLFHFPQSASTHTEDLLRVKSRELPAPLALKNNRNLDTVFGKSTYGNATSLVGLSDDDRSRHMYLIGQTGSGKTTVIYHMASDDIKKGRGLAVVDPHGDLAEDLLNQVPDERIPDLIYFNPFDIKYPVGINLLELSSCLDEDELELEKELVCESVISIFRRVFSKDENADAHRIEYILRNTIYTAFTVPNCTIFTIYDLLNDPTIQKQAVRNLKDENLLHFWRNEFGKAGNYQIVKMVGGVTAKVGRFLFSPTAKRILEQPKSTINFDDILDSKKILICNLAEGKIGEDTSQLLGTTVIAKIHQAAMRRARKSAHTRTPFYLFIDEFQNFATSSFTKLLSGGRKFGLRIAIAEQSTSQQENRNIVNVILANTGTVVCFRTASPIDEDLMLAQFAPTVHPGDITNLPRYHFYIKLSAVKPEEPFSGITLPIVVSRDSERIEQLIGASRANYAITYQKPKQTAASKAAKPKDSEPDHVQTVDNTLV